ncbi:hypothetical protein NC652_028034 [Populus alba x Populus x berolinensis]|nr:hypothetical protein NC652_028034 [Populus alba x Populus x berolinensis]
MNESELQENDHDDESIHNRNEFLRFDYKSYVDSLSLCDALKCCPLKFVINGADKVFMDKKSRKEVHLAVTWSNAHNRVFFTGVFQVKAGRIGALVRRAVRFIENMLLNRKVKIAVPCKRRKWKVLKWALMC